MDYVAKKGLYDLLNDLKKKGRTILITTHEIDYMEDICDEAVILSKGRLVYLGNPKKVLAECSRVNKINVEYLSVLDADLAKQIWEKYSCAEGENSIDILFSDPQQKQEIADMLMKAYNVSKLSVNTATIREALENVLTEME